MKKLNTAEKVTLTVCTIVTVLIAIYSKSILAHLKAAEPFARFFSCICLAAPIGGLAYQLWDLGKGGRNV